MFLDLAWATISDGCISSSESSDIDVHFHQFDKEANEVERPKKGRKEKEKVRYLDELYLH